MIVEDTDATNALINDGQFVQPLTLDEIEALKRSGLPASVRGNLIIEEYGNKSIIIGDYQKAN